METRKNTLREQTPNLTPDDIVGSFLDFCQDNLGYTTPASVELVTDRDSLVTLASYNLNDNSVKVYSRNRALADILRSIAHELVHHKQLEDGRIDINNPPQDIGGEIEDEANAVAGQLVKAFGYTGVNIYENWDKTGCADPEQGKFFCQDKGVNIGITDIFKGDGHNIIHGFAQKFHLSDVTPESEETYNDPVQVKPKENDFKPNLRKGPFNVPAQSRDLLTLINEEKDPNKLKLVQEVIHNQLRFLNKKVLKENYLETTEELSKNPENTISNVYLMVINHILKDYSKMEIEEMNGTNLYDFNINNILKLYGLDEKASPQKLGKQLIQFIVDNNYMVNENNLGDPLPSLNQYMVIKKTEVLQRIHQDWVIKGEDTNFNAFMCGVEEDFWNYNPTVEREEVVDEDYMDDVGWTLVRENGVTVWEDRGSYRSKSDNPFNPYNTECDY